MKDNLHVCGDWVSWQLDPADFYLTCIYRSDVLPHFNFLFLHKFLLERKITYYAKLFAVLEAALSSVKCKKGFLDIIAMEHDVYRD